MRLGFVRAALVAGGLMYVFSGAALLFTPEWFFENIGTFPPFNRHYMGDAGTFLLPLGIVLLLIVRHPERHRALIAFAAVGSLIHALNHTYDDIIAGSDFGAWMGTTIPLFILAAVLIAAYFAARRAEH